MVDVAVAYLTLDHLVLGVDVLSFCGMNAVCETETELLAPLVNTKPEIHLPLVLLCSRS